MVSCTNFKTSFNMTYFRLSLLLVLLSACGLSNSKSDPIISFFENELRISPIERANKSYYLINGNTCSACLESNFRFLYYENHKLNIIPIIIGNINTNQIRNYELFISLNQTK